MRRKSPEIKARNPNARARSSEPKLIRIPKNTHPVKSLFSNQKAFIKVFIKFFALG